jgi:hypothetical protein
VSRSSITRKDNERHERERREARLNAEDRAVEYLSQNFQPEVSAAIATTVEHFFAEKWMGEREELLRRKDQGKYFQILKEDLRRVQSAFSKIPPRTSNPAGEQHLYQLMSKFRPDERWFIVEKVARYLRWKWAREKLPPLDNGVSSMDFSGLITTAPEIP